MFLAGDSCELHIQLIKNREGENKNGICKTAVVRTISHIIWGVMMQNY